MRHQIALPTDEKPPRADKTIIDVCWLLFGVELGGRKQTLREHRFSKHNLSENATGFLGINQGWDSVPRSNGPRKPGPIIGNQADPLAAHGGVVHPAEYL